MTKLRYKEKMELIDNTNLPGVIIDYLNLKDNSTHVLDVYKNVQKLRKQYLKDKPVKFKNNHRDLQDLIKEVHQEKQNKENGIL